MAESIIKKPEINNNKLSSYIDIASYASSDNKYVFPSNGYLTLWATASANSYISAFVYSANESNFFGLSCSYDKGNGYNAVYVKKGMKCYITVNNNAGLARFISFV